MPDETPSRGESRELTVTTDSLPVRSLPERAEAPITVIQTGGRPGPNPYFMLAAGLLIGWMGTVVAMRNQTPTSLTAKASGPARVETPFQPPRVGTQTVNPKGVPEPEARTAAAGLPGGTGAEPMNPFDEGMVLPSLTPPRPGDRDPLAGIILPRNLPTSPIVTAPPSTNASPPPPNVTATTTKQENPLDKLPKAPPALKIPTTGSKVVNVQTVTNGGETAAIADDLIGYVKKHGGTAYALTEAGVGDRTVVKGVQATVPDGELADLLKYATTVGANVVDRSTWTGDSGQRSQRLVQEAESRLASLKKLREALLVTYLEDARPVKDVDAEIAEAQAAVDEIKSGKVREKMTVVKFAFLKPAS